MGPVEVCLYTAMLAFLLYARTQTHLLRGHRWGIIYSVLAILLVLWLVRIGHLLLFGPDY
jgi:hypothetical protein